MSYFYGPVFSKRLGYSLGVNLLSPEAGKKICTFDCIYCQAGRTTRKNARKFSFADFNGLKKELRAVIKKRPKVDYLTFSGRGESTLCRNLGRVITLIRKVTKRKIPICVITNSSLLSQQDVRRQLLKADLIIPSLDAVTAKTFRRINKPHRTIKLARIINGLINLRREFKGKIWLEIMLVKGLNDRRREAEGFKEIIRKFKPEKIQLNLPTRPAPEKIFLPGCREVQEIAEIIGGHAEVVTRRDLRSRQKKRGKVRPDD